MDKKTKYNVSKNIKFYTYFQKVYLEVRESPAPLNIPTPTPEPRPGWSCSLSGWLNFVREFGFFFVHQISHVRSIFLALQYRRMIIKSPMQNWFSIARLEIVNIDVKDVPKSLNHNIRDIYRFQMVHFDLPMFSRK